MNELDLPTAPPLPADVRERALGTVRAEMQRPRRTPYLAAAAAVITTLLVSSLAVAWLGRPDVGPSTGGTVTATPMPPDSSALLARCISAVTSTGRAADYPPSAEWRVTGVLLRGAREQAVAVNDAFACYATASTVNVTATRGVPAGGVEIVRLAPAHLAVLNPRSLAFQVDTLGFGTAPVTLVRLGRADEPAADFHLTVVAVGTGPEIRRSWDGPMPEPEAVPVTIVDPTVTTSSDLRLGECLADNLPSTPAPWRPVMTSDVADGIPPVAVGQAGDSYAGFCFADPAGPIYADGALPPIGGRTNPGIVATIRGADSVRVVLVAVPPDTRGADIAAGTSAPCQVEDGLALCTVRTTDPVTVTVHAGTDVVLPVP